MPPCAAPIESGVNLVVGESSGGMGDGETKEAAPGMDGFAGADELVGASIRVGRR